MSGSELALAFVSGGIGWLAGLAMGERYSGRFPASTFAVNISIDFLIGFLTVLFRFDWMDRFGHPLDAIVLTEILGGYTTFSSMALDSSTLIRDGETRLAAFYLGGFLVA